MNEYLETFENMLVLASPLLVGGLAYASYLAIRDNKKEFEEKKRLVSDIEEKLGPRERYIALAIMDKFKGDSRGGVPYTTRFKNSAEFARSMFERSDDFLNEAYSEYSRRDEK